MIRLANTYYTTENCLTQYFFRDKPHLEHEDAVDYIENKNAFKHKVKQLIHEGIIFEQDFNDDYYKVSTSDLYDKVILRCYDILNIDRNRKSFKLNGKQRKVKDTFFGKKTNSVYDRISFLEKQSEENIEKSYNKAVLINTIK